MGQLFYKGNKIGALTSSDAEEINFDPTSSEMESTNVQDAIDELKKSVSDGKKIVANAITTKGISTPIDASFQTMATNINKITTGGGSGGGSNLVFTDMPINSSDFLFNTYSVDEYELLKEPSIANNCFISHTHDEEQYYNINSYIVSKNKLIDTSVYKYLYYKNQEHYFGWTVEIFLVSKTSGKYEKLPFCISPNFCVSNDEYATTKYIFIDLSVAPKGNFYFGIHFSTNNSIDDFTTTKKIVLNNFKLIKEE